VKRLVRLLLINWYRLEQASIEFEGHTAFIGPNASGKSSLLDAVQAVLVGGDKRWWNPNASAGEKSTRSLRDYCLGVVRDPDNPDLSQEFRPREQAITYLVLVFREDDGTPVSIGLALHARLDEPRETIDGRFIAPGLDLIIADLVDQSGAGRVPKPWKRLREELRRRAGEAFQAPPQAGEYQRHLCAQLSDGKRHLSAHHFLRAFRNAITFAPIRNVSEFVRNYILEERPIQVRSLQQALQDYRDIQERTREARAREEALSAIDKQYRRAEQAEQGATAWRWVEEEAAFNALEAQMDPLREGLEKRKAEIAALADRIETLDQEWQSADSALHDANKRLAASDVELQRDRLKAEREVARQKLDRLARDINDAHRWLGRVHPLLDHAEELQDPALVVAMEALVPLLARDGDLLTAPWPMAPADVMRAVTRLHPLLATAAKSMLERYEVLVREAGEMERELANLSERIKRLSAGGSDLHTNTRHLIALLGEHGIDAVPLCDRVDVADEHWRLAMEAFLGGHREALLVSPAQVRDAVGLYRREGKRLGIYGSRIVNTLKTGEWQDRCTDGSLAEMAASEDPHAIAYINRQAGNVLRVESETELLRHERAITADGMLATGGSVRRMLPVEEMLGRGARARTLETLQRRYADEGKRQYERTRDKEVASRVRDDLLMPLAQHLDGFPDLIPLADERSKAQTRLHELEAEEASLTDDADYRRLQAEAERRKRDRDAIRASREACVSQKTNLTIAQDKDETELWRMQAHLKAAAERRTAIQQQPGFDAHMASSRLQELLEQEMFSDETAASWEALGAEAARRGGIQESTSKKQRGAAHDGLAKYWLDHPAENRPTGILVDDHRPLSAWVVRELTQLRETQLAQYVTEAENALREAEHAFRSDFVGKLQENLQLLEGQLEELNRNLKHRPFHGQYYRFIKKSESDLRQVLDWVKGWSPEQGGDVGGLFDAADDPNHPHRDAIARVRNLLMEAAGGDGKSGTWDERLADYRQYYSFDVRMSDDREGSGNPELLSRRLGKGSGGEHQAPFYVAIGAALAAAYRIERNDDGSYRGGINLAVFDEAFSKLDVQNTVSAIGFLDELGLQVVLAAPDEKYGQIAEHVDTIINVYRDGGNVNIDADYVKPAAKRALAADNPVRSHDNR
jgi:energy-coupling factor transporter ATP-binding protein EcfA2